MQFEPTVAVVEATRAVHDGAAFALVTLDNRVHCLEGQVFDLLFRPRLVCDAALTTEELEAPAVAQPVARRDCIPLRSAGAAECLKKAAKKGATKQQRAWTEGGSAVKPAPSTEPRVVEDLDDYPAALRHPLAIQQRKVFLSLRTDGPADLSTLCERLKEESAPVSTALFNMRQKELVIAPMRVGGAWSLV